MASLIVKTLREMNTLRDGDPGGELNIIFDNCTGQNKNNTVLKLAMWLKEMDYFTQVNFVHPPSKWIRYLPEVRVLVAFKTPKYCRDASLHRHGTNLTL